MHKQKGFTLIELLVVIAIFALIANVTMVSLNKAKRESRDAKRMENINQIRAALHLYSTDNLDYPQGDAGGNPIALGTDGHLVLDDSALGFTDGSSPQSPVFMYSVPRDPSEISAETSDSCTGISTGICDYSYVKNGNDYILYFYLEGGVGDYDAGLHAATKDSIL